MLDLLCLLLRDDPHPFAIRNDGCAWIPEDRLQRSVGQLDPRPRDRVQKYILKPGAQRRLSSRLFSLLVSIWPTTCSGDGHGP